MGKPGAYLEVARREHDVCSVADSVAGYEEIARPLPWEEQRKQASRCMYCGVAFCQAGISFEGTRPTGCPLHNLIPEWNDLLYRGLWKQAAERLDLTNPFPEFTGRVCPAPCELACNLGLNDCPTTIRDNERAISDWSWNEGVVAPLEPASADAASQETIDSAMNAIAAMATCSMQETQIENLLLAKDFADCVVYIGNGAVTVAVPAPIEGLSEEAVARITDVICTETEYDPTQLNIIEVKA